MATIWNTASVLIIHSAISKQFEREQQMPTILYYIIIIIFFTQCVLPVRVQTCTSQKQKVMKEKMRG